MGKRNIPTGKAAAVIEAKKAEHVTEEDRKWRVGFGKRLRVARTQPEPAGQELTQAELGDRVGVSQGEVSKYEGGTSTPNAWQIVRLSQVLNVSVGYLLGTTKVRGEAGSCVKIDLSHAPENLLDFLEDTKAIPHLIVAKGMYEKALAGASLDAVIACLEDVRGFLVGLRPPSTDEKDTGANRADHRAQGDSASRGDRRPRGSTSDPNSDRRREKDQTAKAP